MFITQIHIMKKLLLILFVVPVFCQAQDECESVSHMAVGISYILPKSVSVEGAYFTAKGFTAGIGVAYTQPAKFLRKSADTEYSVHSNMLNVFAYAGYRVFHRDYKLSAYLNAGYTMGDVDDPYPLVSARLLFPSGQKAFSVEPMYVFNRGIGGRATLYLKL